MTYLLAAIGALAIAVLLWRVLTAERVGVPADERERKRRPAPPVAPDDDPDFLRKLGEQTRKKEEPDDKDEK